MNGGLDEVWSNCKHDVAMQREFLHSIGIFLFVFSQIWMANQVAYPQFGLERNVQEKKETDSADQFDLDSCDSVDESEELSQSEDSGPKVKGLNGPKFGKATTVSWESGFRLKAVGKCTNIVLMITIPMDWPEQKVTILEERDRISSNISKIDRQTHKNGGLRQMVVRFRELEPNKTAEAALVVKVTRNEILPPDPQSIPKLSIPPAGKIPKAYKIYLEKSPNIESHNAVFKKLYAEITKGIDSDWAKIEAIYSYVRENIGYNDANKATIGNGALETLRLKKGDCKEMTAVFIAICRAGKIPARTVWIPGHCYVEFYMIDDDGIGYWFPCQVSGTYAFGGIPEMGPVLQKGDNFTFPELRGEQFRIVGQQITGQNEGGSSGAPKCEFFENQL